MTVGELIEKLETLPKDWAASFTKSESLWVSEPPHQRGARFGFVFEGDKPTKIVTRRS